MYAETLTKVHVNCGCDYVQLHISVAFCRYIQEEFYTSQAPTLLTSQPFSFVSLQPSVVFHQPKYSNTNLFVAGSGW